MSEMINEDKAGENGQFETVVQNFDKESNIGSQESFVTRNIQIPSIRCDDEGNVKSCLMGSFGAENDTCVTESKMNEADARQCDRELPVVPEVIVNVPEEEENKIACDQESNDSNATLKGDDIDNDEDDDDHMPSHFQATVLKRGSVTVEKKGPVSPRGRALRKISSNLQEDDHLKAAANIITSLSRLTAQTKKDLPKKSIAQSPQHAICLEQALDRMKTQIPRSLELDIREEALGIIQDTAHAYKKLLGKKHHLTVEAYDYIGLM